LNSLRRVLCGGLTALACFSGSLSAQLLSDPDSAPAWKEGEYALPAAPGEASLRPFFVSSASPNRFLIDEDTLSVSDDGVVRYVLVVRTPGGAQNVTFEGIRCGAGAWRIYATGRPDGEWVPTRNGDWRPIVDTSYNRSRAALALDYFCDGPAPPRDRAEVLRRLHDSGRPHDASNYVR